MPIPVNTINTKQVQLANGSYSMGTGKTVMLVIGSCRTIPYLNYLHYLSAGNVYTIHFIDPFNWHYDANGNRADFEAKINSLETDPRILRLLKSAKVYIHEFYNSFGMFNSSKTNAKNIYQFGLTPDVDVTMPNFNDVFILFQDVADYKVELRKAMQEDVRVTGRVTDATIEAVKASGYRDLDKFFNVCQLSDLREFGPIFEQDWRKRRFFWNSNHVSNQFTMEVFRLLNDKFLKLATTPQFWQRAGAEDMYCRPHTPMTNYDVQAYGLSWPMPIKELQL